MRRRVMLLSLLLCASLCIVSAMVAQEMGVMQIAGRVTSISEDGSTVVVNRGSNDNLITDSLCYFLPNRGIESADIDWDIQLGTGTIKVIEPESVFIEQGIVYDTVKVGDYCGLYASLPTFILQTDVGNIMHWDIIFLDYEKRLPLFELKSLIQNPTQAKVDSIIDILIDELHKHSDTVEVWSSGKIIKGGMFDGLGWGEAFKKTKKEHVELYLQYVRYLPGRLINYYWWFIETYATWMINEMPTAESEKKTDLALPYAQKGDDLIDSGKFQEAIEAYKEALSIYPDYSYATDMLETVGNVIKYRNILQQDPNDVNTQFELAWEHYNLGRYDDAMEHFTRAKELGYDSIPIKKYMGYIQVFQGMYSKAVKIFTELHAMDKQDKNIQKWLTYSKAREKQDAKKGSADAYLMTGNVKYEEENWDDAVDEYKKALSIEPENTEIRKRIKRTVMREKAHQEQIWAVQNWDRGEFERAKERWKDAIAICDGIGDSICIKTILTEMANGMYDMGFYDDAIDVYKQVIEIVPGEYDAYISISNCYKGKKEYENAILWVKRGIKVNPDDAWGHNILGLIYLKAGEFDKGIKPLNKAGELDSAYKYPHYNLGQIYIRKEDYDKADYHLRKAIEIDKNYWDARHDIQNIMCVREEKIKLKDHPNDAAALLRYGRALWHMDDYGRSVEVLRRLIAARPDDVVALSYLGYSYTELGNYQEGKRYLEKAYTLNPIPNLRAWILYNESLKRLAIDPADAGAYLKSGESNLYWEYYYSALSDFEIARKLGADTMLIYDMLTLARKGNEAKKFYDTSTDYYNRSEYEKAIEYALKSLELYRQIRGKQGVLSALQRLGWCHAGLFKHEEALAYYEKAGKVADELFDVPKKAHYISAVGDYYWNLGDFENALKYKREAKKLYHQEFDYVNEASVISNIGTLVGNLGEFDEMVDNYKRALELHKMTLYYQGESSSLNSLGWAYIGDGDYSQALEYQLKSLAVARNYNDRWNELRAYGAIGSIYSDLGDSLNAIQYLKCYLETATALGSKETRANALNSLGLVYLDLFSDYDQAREYFSVSRDLSKLIGYDLGVGVSISNIGVTYSRQGRCEEALEYQKEGLRIVRGVHSKYTEMQGLNEIGETYQTLEMYDMALESHLEAIEIAKSFGERNSQWIYEFNAGKTYEGKEDLQNAVKYYKMAAVTLTGIKKKIRSEELLKQFGDLQRQTEVYKRLIDLLIRMGKPDEAIKYIEESKSKIVKDAFGDIKPKTDNRELNVTLEEVDKIEKKREALEKELVEEKKKPKEKQDKTKIDNLSSTLASTEGEFNQWMMKLKFQNRHMFDALTIKPTTLGDVQHIIPENTVLLEYFISSDKIYIFCIGKQYFIAKSVDVTEAEITGLIDYYIGIVKDPHSDISEELNEPAMKLYEYLMEPVEEEISRFENIVIVPFGALYYLPFHALMHEQDGRVEYLIEWKRISYTTSATFADVLNYKRKEIEKLIAMGNPDGSLPAASEEVEILRDQIFKKDAIIWTLDEATKDKFLESAKDYDVIHLATHGNMQSNPLESYLLFAGDSEDEQRLTLLEVAGYTALRNKTTLVFLSACQTATEEGRGTGSELISLAEAFAMAGPPTLIATLWEVNDVSTSKLAVKFYHVLRREKKDKLEALRRAQLALLKSDKYSHPFFWAPFLLIGSWR